MSYTPKTWVCGEKITADGLNNMESGIQDALECCRGGGDAGYSCTETIATVFDGQLTTADSGGGPIASFTPSQAISGDNIIVTLNGTEYSLPLVDNPYMSMWGEVNSQGMPIFTNYPCVVGYSSSQGGMVGTKTAGTYSVKIEAPTTTTEVSDCFSKAVEHSVAERISIPTVVKLRKNGTCSHTGQQLYDLLQASASSNANVVVTFYGDDNNLLSYHSPICVPQMAMGGFDGMQVYVLSSNVYGNRTATIDRYILDRDYAAIRLLDSKKIALTDA